LVSETKQRSLSRIKCFVRTEFFIAITSVPG
jgi:hypothetical protein